MKRLIIAAATVLAAACQPGFSAVQYVVPRVIYQFAKACRGGHVKDFFRAMRSARTLLPTLLRSRKPLKNQTLQRIVQMKHGLVP